MAFNKMTYHFEEGGLKVVSLNKVDYLLLDVLSRVP